MKASLKEIKSLNNIKISLKLIFKTSSNCQLYRNKLKIALFLLLLILHIIVKIKKIKTNAK